MVLVTIVGKKGICTRGYNTSSVVSPGRKVQVVCKKLVILKVKMKRCRSVEWEIRKKVKSAPGVQKLFTVREKSPPPPRNVHSERALGAAPCKHFTLSWRRDDFCWSCGLWCNPSKTWRKPRGGGEGGQCVPACYSSVLTARFVHRF